MTLRLGAVVASAGLSSRMGREKVLLPWGSSTVLSRVLWTLERAGVMHRVVVLRRGLEEAGAQAKAAGARVCWNPHPETGMLESFRIGLAALDPEVQAFFAWPADHPAVELETVRLLASHAESGLAIVPRFRGRRGHPAVIGAGLAGPIRAIPHGEGLRQLWRDRPEILREISVEDEGVVLDLDTPADYENALRLLDRSRENRGPGEG